MDSEAAARDYYRAIDERDWDALEEILGADFVQVRGDRTLDGRDSFVSFMRDKRPDPDTEHVVDAVYTGEDGVAVEGRLLRGSGEEWFRFVDVFECGGNEEGEKEGFVELRTYSR